MTHLHLFSAKRTLLPMRSNLRVFLSSAPPGSEKVTKREVDVWARATAPAAACPLGTAAMESRNGDLVPDHFSFAGHLAGGAS